jgi:Ca-activated chloride channel family protein
MNGRWRVPLLVLFAVGLLAGASAGQSGTAGFQATGATITGRIVDGTRTAMPGVTVTLEQDARIAATTVSDNEGRFRFSGVKPGTYQLRTVLAGFAPTTREVTIQSARDVLHQAIVLARNDASADPATKLDSVQVTNLPANAYRNYQALTVLSPEEAGQRSEAPATEAAGRGGASGGIRPLPAGATAAPPPPASVHPAAKPSDAAAWIVPGPPPYGEPGNAESYRHVRAHRFVRTLDQPLSTFGADVDTASYANVRRFLSHGQLPPEAAVRVEEFVNYFRFDYPAPRGTHPISVTTEVGDAPWAPGHKLVLIGARAKASDRREIEGRNLVLLLDVSGSMAPADKLPLIKSALRLFVDALDPDDRLAIVTYAGTTGVALPSTPVRRRDVILRAIDGLHAGGSTNGGQGLLVAYEIARRSFIAGGVNRVVLATDGDFNVGIVSQRDLLHLITRERESGVFLSVFGVGTGNLKDSTMEMLADRGNGHYAYLDSLREARRVLVREGNATLDTIAKDVKFQVEFNPAVVAAWRQIGYENRALAAEDFNDDRKDAGEMGAGHTVTALYEIIPAGLAGNDDVIRIDDDRPGLDPLRYQPAPVARRPPPVRSVSVGSEWLTVKTRYKLPDGDESRLLTVPVRTGGHRIEHLPLAAAVAEFGMLLRDGRGRDDRWSDLSRRLSRLNVSSALTADVHELAELVELARGLAR